MEALGAPEASRVMQGGSGGPIGGGRERPSGCKGAVRGHAAQCVGAYAVRAVRVACVHGGRRWEMVVRGVQREAQESRCYAGRGSNALRPALPASALRVTPGSPGEAGRWANAWGLFKCLRMAPVWGVAVRNA